MALTIQDLKTKNLLLFEGISGSKAYGLNTPTSDTDIRGVFVLPEADYFGLDYTEQLSNESNDIVYYELKRFVDLLAKNNPNMLEMLAMPEDCVLYKHPLYDQFKPELFLSRLCKNTFAGYALTQVKKAKGLNKKIVNPVEPERKSILDFCYVAKGQGSVPVQQFLAENGTKQKQCGLAKIPHMPDLYALFYAAGTNFKGIAPHENANDVSLSSIPKGMEPIALMTFNKNAYSTYCKEYLDYWEWVEKRNDARYQNTLSHGKNYDAKNLMHTFRLLDMAEEIGSTGKIIVRRPNRKFLLKIRTGEFEYAELVAMAEERIAKMDKIYERSNLPETPDLEKINETLVRVRKEFYKAVS
ncbi:nucleotidyltransferase domain-containing protein [Adhaeribacter sp. BT258]|uniref:Nucleotidyltransferase domain-containing protein n=1 Tax=Adhaeribacter terrigena TaxID=2793070 RepID=A0ABS1BZS7_9BACT|nr:nucleotidyltransferase domain-containing protein [Adhaeribacter terrigena]MBK0402615.1 nucleotidyltransferase domain-containing protein [Adhaeribacter terrigena]